jgi:hypothetical protein
VQCAADIKVTSQCLEHAIRCGTSGTTRDTWRIVYTAHPPNVQAQLDGAPLPAAPPAAILDDAHMLPMIEDELDADTHSWLPSLRQVCGALADHMHYG